MSRSTLLLVACSASSAALSAAAECSSSRECDDDSLCIRGACTTMMTHAPGPRPRPGASPSLHIGKLPDTCFEGAWPNLTACVSWTKNATTRFCESNNVPPYDVPAYCPCGIGQGYCGSPTTGENASTDCDPFRDMVCPCATGDDDSVSCPDDSPNYGDVMVTSYQRFEFARFPDPTDAAKPKHMCGDERAVHGHSAWLRHVYHLFLFPTRRPNTTVRLATTGRNEGQTAAPSWTPVVAMA